MQDIFPVAIKHIPREDVHYKQVVQNGVEYNLIDEVALMVKVAQGPCPAVVRMLDCYELPEEVILVMERPYPAMDLLKYKNAKEGVLEEEEARVILKQMVEASIQMHNRGVFHRDLKLENILVEMGHRVPKAWVIDFGCGCLVKEGTYDYYAGTFSLAPPEWYSSKAYSAEPTTVYHLGTLLYDLLHQKSFNTLSYLRRKRRVKIGLSKECRDFLQCCLAPDPVKRASFLKLQSHPWLH
ncbi:serine/threonine-protein kinase pim-1-like isoform X2 [Eucyclogobius newberryi]|uniref:serine/threonine-protein kinase pim-1-like isoform X2 n=1 Tax=Eucyclogobius newberryi TaxID=166745 RepID=UPI003B59C39D